MIDHNFAIYESVLYTVAAYEEAAFKEKLIEEGYTLEEVQEVIYNLGRMCKVWNSRDLKG